MSINQNDISLLNIYNVSVSTKYKLNLCTNESLLKTLVLSVPVLQ